MRKKTMELLLQMGIPANIRGFYYICDAMEIYEQNEKRTSAKLCKTYQEIALKNNVSASTVERCIRHAFEKIRGNGDLFRIYGENVEKQNHTNGNLLSCLYLRLKDEAHEE